MALRRSPTFADLLKAWRRAAGLTQEELAERAALSVRGISDLERGVKQRPYLDTVRRLADALALSANQHALLETVARGRTGMVAAPPWDPSETELVGRTGELDLLRRHLDGSSRPVLFVDGAPGIGKSRLLRESCRLATERGFAVMSAACNRRSRHEPYAPLAEAIGVYLTSQEPRRQRALLNHAGWLVRLLPEILDEVDMPLPLITRPGDGEYRLLCAAVDRFLANIEPTPAVLVLDDLQWAGSDAIDLLASIAASAGQTGARVIAAYRDTEVDASSDVFALRRELITHQLATELSVPPLSTSHSETLLERLAGRIDTPSKADAVRRSGGVPFYLCSFASSIASGAGGEGVPQTVAESVRMRLATVSPHVQDLLTVTTVMGRNLPLGLLRQVVDMNEPETVSALEEACRARLLVEVEGERYAFAHDIIGDVVDADLGAARRRMIHRRVAHALMDLPAEERRRHSAELAWHLSRADEPAQAADYALLAGDQATRAVAYAEAADHYSAAASMAEGRDSARRAEALYRLGIVCLSQGRHGNAAEALTAAADLRRTLSDLEGEAMAIAQLGWAQFYRGDSCSIIPRASVLIQALESGGASPALCSLYLLLTLLLFGTDPAGGLEAAEKATAMAETLHDRELLVQAEVRRGLALGGIGRWEEGAEILQAIAPLAEEIGDLVRLTEGLAFVGVAYLICGKLQRSVEFYGRSMEAAERLNSPGHLAYGLGGRALALFSMGRWSEARADAERAVALDREHPTMAFASTYTLTLARLAEVEGRWEDADRYLEETARLAPSDEQRTADVRRAVLDARRAMLQGCASAAREVLSPHLAEITAQPSMHLFSISLAAEILLETGEVCAAQRLLDAAQTSARSSGEARVLPDLQRVRGLCLSRTDKSSADAELAAALARATSLPNPHLEGLILRDWARISIDERVRRLRLERALAIFRRLGAAPDTERTLALLDSPV